MTPEDKHDKDSSSGSSAIFKAGLFSLGIFCGALGVKLVEEVIRHRMGCVGSKAVDTDVQAPVAKEAVKVPVATEAKLPGVKIGEGDKVLLDLKNRRDELNRYKRRLDENAARESDVARELVRAGKRDRAALVLRRRKAINGYMETADGMLSKVEDLIASIESAETQRECVDILAQGSKQLKKLNEALKLEDVERLLEDNEEQIAYQKQITNMLAGTTSLSSAEDAELDAELESLGADPTGKSLEAVESDEKEEEGSLQEDAESIENSKRPDLVPEPA